jgi:hypothetical protein
MDNNTSRSSGGFLGTLCLILITLKLTNFIDWSWWWVLSPIWAVPSILILAIILWAILKLIEKISGR